MSDYGYDPGNRPGNASTALGLLVLGLAAGAAVMWLMAPGNKEKIMVGSPGEFTPQEWLERATRILREGRDRLIESVDQNKTDHQA